MQVNANSMMAQSNYMANSAANVANVNTPNYNAVTTTLQNPAQGSVQAVSSTSNSPTDLAKEFTDQIVIQNGFDANARAIKAQDEMIGSLIDLSI